MGSCTGSADPTHELAKLRETILEQANMLNISQVAREDVLSKCEQVLSYSKSTLAKKDKQLTEVTDLCKKLANR